MTLTPLERFGTWLSDRPQRPWWITALLLALLCWLSFFHQLGVLGLMDKTEALFVEVAHQMALSGDWVTPRWNGDTFFDYPVWGYWMVALSFKLFGSSEWAARLPVALAASAVVVAITVLLVLVAVPTDSVLRRFGRGWLGGATLALSPAWIGWGRSSTTDMFLASAISLALMGFLLAYSRGADPWLRRLGYGALPLFCGVAVLAKGPVGLLLPGLVILLFLLSVRELGTELRQMNLPLMLLLFAGVTAPWYGLATQANGMEFLNHFLGFSNLQRFTSVLYAHPGPWYFYLPWLVVLLFPWSLALPAAIAGTGFWRRPFWRPVEEPAQAFPRFALIALVVVVGFFSAAATKLPGYILPSIPAATLLIALAWVPLAPGAEAVDGARLKGLRIGSWITFVLFALLAVAAVLAPSLVATDPAYPRFADGLRQSGLPQVLGLVSAVATLVLLAQLLNRRGGPWLWTPHALLMLGVVAFVVPPLAPLLDRERQLPVRQLAQQAAVAKRPGEPLWVVGYKRYSVVYYSGHSAVFLDTIVQARDQYRHQPGSLGLGGGADSVLLFGERDLLAPFQSGAHGGTILGERGTQQLMRLPASALSPLLQ